MGTNHSVEKIVLFDGVCNLCSASVQFVLRHNSKKNLKFASLQSDFGKNQLTIFHLNQEVRTIVFIKMDKVYLRSDAALEICKELNGIYPALIIFKVVPKFIRDRIYDFISKHRYRWFGQKDECWIPSPEFSQRFIS